MPSARYCAYGIIPAHAGNTAVRWMPACPKWDHPRVCGEHLKEMYGITDEQGSSPRMRGTRADPEGDGLGLGIIPAYAGNTCEPYHSNGLPWDHPRVCGEHPDTMRPERVLRGSSPRMRGTLAGYAHYFHAKGIIPAYAGNTAFSSLARLSSWDHPRVCGEHTQTVPPTTSGAGSSPRMRGTPRTIQLRYIGHGIIPAYAGNTEL